MFHISDLTFVAYEFRILLTVIHVAFDVPILKFNENEDKSLQAHSEIIIFTLAIQLFCSFYLTSLTLYSNYVHLTVSTEYQMIFNTAIRYRHYVARQ